MLVDTRQMQVTPHAPRSARRDPTRALFLIGSVGYFFVAALNLPNHVAAIFALFFVAGCVTWGNHARRLRLHR